MHWEYKQFWRVFQRKKRPLRYLFGLLLRVTRLSPLFTINTKRYQLRFFPTNLTATLFEDAAARETDEAFIDFIVKPGDTVIDIGANVGTFSLAAARAAGPRGKVHSFEPHPRIYSYLLANVRLNSYKTIRVQNLAIGNKNERRRLSDERSDDINHLVDNNGVPVAMRTLDSLFPGSQRLSLLKIDVEGYELYVLQGASQLLSRTDCVYIESYGPNLRRYGFTTEDLRRKLVAAGFRLYRFKSNKVSLVPKNGRLPWQLIALRSAGKQ